MRRPGLSFGSFGGKAGIALAGAGLLAILVGWNGVAGQLTVLGQLPYLVSGGLLGLALVVLGAALLVVQSAREDRALLEARLELLTEALLEGRGRAGAGGPLEVSGLVVAGTASYHVPGCRLVAGREHADYLTPLEAGTRGLKACRICRPEPAAPQVTVG